MMTAHGWRGVGAHRFRDTAADAFTRADPRYREAQRQGAPPMPLAAGEVLELPRERGFWSRVGRVTLLGAVYFAWLLGCCWAAWWLA